jgi:hypothetical protein
MAIKQPFGADLNSNFYGGLDSLGTMTPNEPKRIFTIDSMFSFIRSATATNGKKVALSIDSSLPAGAILVIYHDASPTGSELTLSTGFVNTAKKGLARIGIATTADGTGTFIATFIYNGTAFLPISLINTSFQVGLVKL